MNHSIGYGFALVFGMATIGGCGAGADVDEASEVGDDVDVGEVEQADGFCVPWDPEHPPAVDASGTLVGAPASASASGTAAAGCDSFNFSVAVDPPADRGRFVTVSTKRLVTCGGTTVSCPAEDGVYRLWTKNCTDLGLCNVAWTVGSQRSLDHGSFTASCSRLSIVDPYRGFCGHDAAVYEVPDYATIDFLRVEATATEVSSGTPVKTTITVTQ